DDFLNIDTPENVVFGYQVAGIGSRFLAAMVDTIAIVILQIVVLWTLALALNILELGENSGGAWLAAIFSLLSFVLLWGYYIYFESVWNGQTPGKRWAKLRVIRTDGTPITLAEVVIRNLVRLVDFLPIFYGVGIVTMFVNEQSRRLGDLAAGTLVVHEREAVTLDSLAARPAVASTLGFRFLPSDESPDLPVERLTAEDIQMAEDFLRRRRELPNSAELASRIARVLYSRMEVPPTRVEGWEAEKAVALIVRAYHARQI
ncbi:MAG: RDD family protein, partial [Chloroflexi bacterium]|nr:RDD family protein [Chloroflexota bacterium]